MKLGNVKDSDLGTTQYLRAQAKVKHHKTLGGKRFLCRLQSLRFALHFDRFYYLSVLFPSCQKFRFYPFLLYKLSLPDLHFIPYSRTLSDPLRPFLTMRIHSTIFFYIIIRCSIRCPNWYQLLFTIIITLLPSSAHLSFPFTLSSIFRPEFFYSNTAFLLFHYIFIDFYPLVTTIYYNIPSLHHLSYNFSFHYQYYL